MPVPVSMSRWKQGELKRKVTNPAIPCSSSAAVKLDNDSGDKSSRSREKS